MCVGRRTSLWDVSCNRAINRKPLWALVHNERCCSMLALSSCELDGAPGGAMCSETSGLWANEVQLLTSAHGGSSAAIWQTNWNLSQAAIVCSDVSFQHLRANLDKRWRFWRKWEEKGPLQSAVKGVPLIRQQLRTSQRQLPPPDVIHSPPFKNKSQSPPSIPALSKWHHLKGMSTSTKAAVNRAPTEEKELAKEEKKMKKKEEGIKKKKLLAGHWQPSSAMAEQPFHSREQPLAAPSTFLSFQSNACQCNFPWELLHLSRPVARRGSPRMPYSSRLYIMRGGRGRHTQRWLAAAREEAPMIYSAGRFPSMLWGDLTRGECGECCRCAIPPLEPRGKKERWGTTINLAVTADVGGSLKTAVLWRGMITFFLS